MMGAKKKILFLNRDSSFLVGFTEALTCEGFDLVEPTSYDEAAQYVRRGEVHLMIYAEAPRASSLNICRDIMAQYPRLPIIYIVGNDSELESKLEGGIVENAHRRIVRPLSQKQMLISVMEDLLKIGRWLNVSTPLPSDELFNNIELTSVADTVLKFFADRYKADNIVWLLPDELKRLAEVEGRWERVEMVQRFGNPANLRTHRPTKETDLISVLGEFDFPKGYLAEGPWPILSIEVGKKSIIVPVLKPDGLEVNGFLFFDSIETEDLRRVSIEIEEVLIFMSQHITFSTAYFAAQKQANTDELTGLYNQKYLDDVLVAELEVSEKEKQNFSVLFIDIDYFKEVNDSHGHWTGSALLRQLGGELDDCIRARDYAFRYGGDEFVVVLPDTNQNQALLVAERIRKRIADFSFNVDGLELKITVSVGVAEYPTHAKDKKSLIEMADKAMYLGKDKSRNVVYLAS